MSKDPLPKELEATAIYSSGAEENIGVIVFLHDRGSTKSYMIEECHEVFDEAFPGHDQLYLEGPYMAGLGASWFDRYTFNEHENEDAIFEMVENSQRLIEKAIREHCEHRSLKANSVIIFGHGQGGALLVDWVAGDFIQEVKDVVTFGSRLIFSTRKTQVIFPASVHMIHGERDPHVSVGRHLEMVRRFRWHRSTSRKDCLSCVHPDLYHLLNRAGKQLIVNFMKIPVRCQLDYCPT